MIVLLMIFHNNEMKQIVLDSWTLLLSIGGIKNTISHVRGHMNIDCSLLRVCILLIVNFALWYTDSLIYNYLSLVKGDRILGLH